MVLLSKLSEKITEVSAGVQLGKIQFIADSEYPHGNFKIALYDDNGQ